MSHTVIIPTYNQYEAFLRAALLSALCQDTEDLQIVVIDDGSTPPQEGVVNSVVDDYMVLNHLTERPDAVYHYQPNGGVAAALNAGIERATGEWVHWLSSDDVYLPGKCSTMEKAVWRAAGELGEQFQVAYCAWDEGVPVREAQWPAAQYPTREAQHTDLLKHCYINACTAMWHRSVFEAVGVFEPEFVHAQDLAYLLKCSCRYWFLAVNESLVRRRNHPGQMLHTLHDPDEAAKKALDLATLRDRYGFTGHVWIPTED